MTKLYVGNLPFTATDEAVRALFSKHGTVEKVSLITDRDTGRPRGFGFVRCRMPTHPRHAGAERTDFDAAPQSQRSAGSRAAGRRQSRRPRRY